MIVLIPCSVKPRQELLSLVESLYPDAKIILSVDHQASIEGVEVYKIIRHVNPNSFPPEKIAEYYNEIIAKFIPELGENNDDEAVLLLHENVLIDESSQILLDDINNYIFSSVKKRETEPPFVLKDNADRCIAFTKNNFILCHTFPNTVQSFVNKTSLDFICEELDKLDLEYIYRDEVFISEPGTIWG